MNYYTESCRGNGCCPSDPYSYVTIRGRPRSHRPKGRSRPAGDPLVPEASAEKKGEQGIQGEKGDTGETLVITIA